MSMVRPYPGYPAFRLKSGVMPDFSGAAFSNQEKPEGRQNGSNRIFTLLYEPIPDSMQVFKDGMLMAENLDYEIDIERKRIIFSSNQIPEKESVIRISYRHY